NGDGLAFRNFQSQAQRIRFDDAQNRSADSDVTSNRGDALSNGAVEWRTHARTFQIELRDGVGGFGGFDFGFRLFGLGDGLIEFAGGWDFVLLQFLNAFEILGGVGSAGLG